MAGKTVKKFNCRYEELPVIGSFLKTNLERDKSDFLLYSPDYNDTYISNFSRKITEVEEIINPKSFADETKVVTNKLVNMMNSTKDLLNRLEGYVKRASGLKINPDDFGIKALREKISSRDAEGFAEKLKIVLKNVDDNITVLKQKGYPEEARASLGNISTSVKAANTEQYERMRIKENLILENLEKLNELWDMMQNIMEIGKILYKISKPDKYSDYAINTLMSKVRKEVRKTVEEEKKEESTNT